MVLVELHRIFIDSINAQRVSGDLSGSRSLDGIKQHGSTSTLNFWHTRLKERAREILGLLLPIESKQLLTPNSFTVAELVNRHFGRIESLPVSVIGYWTRHGLSPSSETKL